MARIAATLILIAIAGLIAGCGASHASSAEAERVAVAWLRAMEESNVTRACELMDAENHQRPPEYPGWSRAKACKQRWLHSDNTPLSWKPRPNVISIWGQTDVKIWKVEIDGDTAIVTVDGIGGQGRPVWLQEENGRWLVDQVSYPI